MRESRTPGSVRGVLSNEHPYRDSVPLIKGLRANAPEDQKRFPISPYGGELKKGKFTHVSAEKNCIENKCKILNNRCISESD